MPRLDFFMIAGYSRSLLCSQSATSSISPFCQWCEAFAKKTEGRVTTDLLMLPDAQDGSCTLPLLRTHPGFQPTRARSQSYLTDKHHNLLTWHRGVSIIPSRESSTRKVAVCCTWHLTSSSCFTGIILQPFPFLYSRSHLFHTPKELRRLW